MPSGQSERKSLLAGFNAGIVSGASDNDPTTVATLAVVGSTTIYGLSWLVILIIPMLIAVQSISAAIGTVSKAGLEDLVRKHYGPVWAFVVLASVLAVSVLTLAADLEGGAAALDVLTGIPYRWFVFPLAVVVALMLVFGSYRWIEHALRYVALVFFAYVVAAFVVRPDWGRIAHETLVPHLSSAKEYVAGALALLGTTLTSYAYVWETIELAHERPPIRRLGLVQAEAGLGMAFAGTIFWFILITTGATLGVHHREVQTAQDAAAALAPLAGRFASYIFGIGLLASAALAVPVLAGTCAYVAAEMFGWRASLDASFPHARPFYGALLLALAAGVGIAYAGIPPITILFYSGIAGGLATPITLVIMLLIARNRKIMHGHPIRISLAVCGWIVTAIVVAASAAYLAQSL